MLEFYLCNFYFSFRCKRLLKHIVKGKNDRISSIITNMKIVALGDTHGRTIWKHIVERETYDKVVFIGDYFDTHEGVSVAQQKRNFKDIIECKQSDKNKVVLLFGNHDFHYLSAMGTQYSGYNRYHAAEIEELLLAALDNNYLQMCFHY